MSKSWLWLAAGTLIGALGATWATGNLDFGAIAGMHGKADKTKHTTTFRPPVVTVIEPTPRQFVETLRINGTLVPREEVLIAPQVEGQRIRELLVDTGDYVKKGQLLAHLATENLDSLVDQNAAAIKRTEAVIAQAASAITQAEARLAEATAALGRAKPLSKSGYMPQSLLDQRQAEATSARAALAIARDSLKLATSEKTQAEAQRRELIWRRSRTDIHATVDGYILSRSAKVGAIATAVGEPMFRIVKGSEIEFEGEVVSDELHLLEPGQTVSVSVAGIGMVTGTVRLVSPRVTPETRLGIARIFIGNDKRLRVGAFASGTITTSKSEGLAIPSGSVMRDNKGAYVQVVIADKVAVRRVEIGLTSDGYVEVRKGLTSSDQVIAKAGTFLGEGEQIQPLKVNNGTQQSTAPKAG
jgi:RND family efflux transporter MFP subunit